MFLMDKLIQSKFVSLESVIKKSQTLGKKCSQSMDGISRIIFMVFKIGQPRKTPLLFNELRLFLYSVTRVQIHVEAGNYLNKIAYVPLLDFVHTCLK